MFYFSLREENVGQTPSVLVSGTRYCWGIPAPHARTGGVLILAHRRLKHTDTIIYVVRQIAYIHGRESILLEIRERIQKYM
jgi:hypothetical protein